MTAARLRFSIGWVAGRERNVAPSGISRGHEDLGPASLPRNQLRHFLKSYSTEEHSECNNIDHDPPVSEVNIQDKLGNDNHRTHDFSATK